MYKPITPNPDHQPYISVSERSYFMACRIQCRRFWPKASLRLPLAHIKFRIVYSAVIFSHKYIFVRMQYDRHTAKPNMHERCNCNVNKAKQQILLVVCVDLRFGSVIQINLYYWMIHHSYRILIEFSVLEFLYWSICAFLSQFSL